MTSLDCLSASTVESTVREVMLRHPKTLPAQASLAQARAALSNDHVHLVLLTAGIRLVGTLTRTDLPLTGTSAPALPWSTLAGRTVSPNAPVTAAYGVLLDHGVRRLAVVDTDGSLLGLLCLKQRRTGFCCDADVEARRLSASRTGRSGDLATAATVSP